MSTSPRFLIAKYIPEPRRMEPRNIGVVVWVDGHTAARFIGDNTETQTTEHYPRFVRSRNYPVYKDWVSYWRQLLTQESLPAGRGRASVPRTSPEFLDALRLKSKENFVLVQGGIIPASVKPRELPKVAEDLFVELIDDGKSEDYELTEARLLAASTKAFLRHSGLKRHPSFNTHYPVQYSFYGVPRHVEFSFGLGGSADNPSPQPNALFQITRLSDKKDVNNSLVQFEGITRGEPAILPINRCASFVYAAKQLISEDATESLRSLEKVSKVIDLSDMDLAINEFKHLMGPLLNGHANGNGHHE
jgi:hypothetical protein